jgi:plasmid stabilization system protein ParE
VAARFRDEFRATVSRIKANPHAGALVNAEIDPTGRTRRRMVRNFPYLVFYLVGTDVIRIVAVAHVKQEPGYWASRLP